ncbi:L-serine deaminase [Sphingomonas sp. SORGH_AS870]|nr:L-serine deaminase [Sphingomonas sp. SORGH_AS_0870]
MAAVITNRSDLPQTKRSVQATLLRLVSPAFAVPIYPDEPEGPAAEVVASVASLVAYATDADAARGGGVSSSIALVAGAGFEPAAFRL